MLITIHQFIQQYTRLSGPCQRERMTHGKIIYYNIYADVSALTSVVVAVALVSPSTFFSSAAAGVDSSATAGVVVAGDSSVVFFFLKLKKDLCAASEGEAGLVCS